MPAMSSLPQPMPPLPVQPIVYSTPVQQRPTLITAIGVISIVIGSLGLLFNGLVKVTMQFFILFVGAMVFVFYQFVAPPLSFNPVQREKVSARVITPAAISPSQRLRPVAQKRSTAALM